MILDTTFLIDVLRGREEVDNITRELEKTETLFITPISVMELWEGIHLTDADEEELRKVEELLNGLHETGFRRESAKRAGEINARLKKEGDMIDVEDVIIGAIALENDEEVMTRNVSDFGRVDGLKIRSY
ncbi:MAG: PIN domain-containing protein [Halobacteria archaeon]|nr:PIN domain-containing protein [Halobacteria archaeon]